MNWPTTIALLGLFLLIGLGTTITTLSKNPFTIRLEADDNTQKLVSAVESLREQKVVVVNQTLVDGCNLSITSCATTVFMFAGHSESPSAYFANSTIRSDYDSIRISGFKNKLKTTHAVGDSMKPFMGNVTILYRTEGKPMIGDMVVYNATWSKTEKYVLHQVVEVQDGYYTTKGYNNPSADEHNTSFSNILGIVVGVLY